MNKKEIKKELIGKIKIAKIEIFVKEKDGKQDVSFKYDFLDSISPADLAKSLQGFVDYLKGLGYKTK